MFFFSHYSNCLSLIFFCPLVAKQLITFTQELQDVVAKEKDTMATFECETSEPFVKVKWYKDGIEIHTGDKYRMHSDRKVHFLSVLTIDTSDAEDYSCVLVEDENVKTTAKLIVEGKINNDYIVYWSRSLFCEKII